MRALGFCLLVVASLPCAAQSTHDFGAVDALIQQVVAGVPLPGASIVAVKDGATILESHYGNYGPNTRIPIASASNWVSATAIASLVDAGLLSWDSAVGSLIVDAPADRRAITLRELFSHRLDGSGTAVVASSAGAFGTFPWMDTSAGVAVVFFTRNLRNNVQPTVRQIIPAECRRAVRRSGVYRWP